PKAVDVIRQGLSFAMLLGLAICVTGWLATPLLMRFMETSAATFANAVPYLRIFFIATPLFALAETIYAVFRASGDTRTPTRVGVTVVIINMVLDPFLIFGIGPFPELGVKGASVASLIAIAIGLVLIVRELRHGKTGYDVTRPFWARPRLSSIWRIARIGLPIATQQLIFVFVYWFLIRFVHRFGEDAGAAMGIGNRMESFSYLVCYGISLAASTMVGQNLGAGQPKRAARCAWTATGAGVGVTLFISVLFLSTPGLIASVFTSDPEVHRIAVDYLVILGLSQFTMAVEIILEGAFSGAGDTLPPMLVSVPGSLARVPLAYLLAFTLDWGINGVWWTLTITTTIKALALAVWFARGKWQQKLV
ncbi:MAG: MATE family efflux transporter, partial [Candidatus Zixiibacteriota bacterium]